MKKKAIIIVGVALVLVIGGAIFLLGGGKVSAVSDPEANTVVLTAKGSGKASGTISVGTPGTVRVEYALEKGSLDVAFSIPGNDFYSVSDLKGTGQEDFENMSGDYTVYFTAHGAAGEAKVFIKN